MHSELDNAIGADTDSDKKKGNSAEGEDIFGNREFIRKAFCVLRVFHTCIITRTKTKKQVNYKGKRKVKKHFFREFCPFGSCKRWDKGV